MSQLRDRFWAVGLGSLAFVWYLLFAPSGLPPEMWGEVSIASSLRAPVVVFPGLARHFAKLLFEFLDYGTACAALAFLGKLLTAVTAGLTYRILRYILHCTGTPLEIPTPKRRFAGDVICLVVTVMFAVSSPMLEASEALSSESLSLFLSFLALLLFFRFLDRGGTFTCGAMLLMFGVVTAETPSGFLFGGIAGVLYLLSIRGLTGFVPRPPSVYVKEIFKWWATIAFALGFFGVIYLNLRMFIGEGGLEANGVDCLYAVMSYVVRYGEICRTTATWTGWILIVGLVIFPLVLALSVLPKAASDERFMKWRFGVAYAVLAVLAASQLGGVGMLWFRSWTYEPCLHSSYLVNLCAFLSAITLTVSLAALSIEAFFRNIRTILRLTAEENPLGRIDYAGARRRRLAIAILVPLGLVLFVCPFANYRIRGEMRSIVDAAVAEIVREAGDAKWLFTDGTLDDGIEIAARSANGRPLYTLSMMPEPGKYAEYRRLRGGFEGEDLHSVSVSAANAFHDWVLYRPERVAESAFLLGFEMWRAAAKSEPGGSGLLARTAYAPGEPARGVAAAEELAGRILAFCARCSADSRRTAGPLLNRLFAAVTWRLSRLAEFRADALERSGRSAEAERKLSKELDAANPFFVEIDRLRRSMAGRPREDVSQREKLKLALMRADFRNAEILARPVLVTDPGNVDANFAMAMHNYFLKNYVLAEAHLVKALDTKPKDGVLWNNLAMCQFRQDNLAAAEKSALEAVRLLPGSSAASNTLVEIRGKRRKGK